MLTHVISIAEKDRLSLATDSVPPKHGRTKDCVEGSGAVFLQFESPPRVLGEFNCSATRICSPAMTDWLHVLTRHHAVAQADSGYEPIFGDPATQERLDEIQTQIGLPLPAELKDLYRSVDGYGLQLNRDRMLSLWFIVPTSSLPGFVSAQRCAIASTHKNLSERYLPFIDWANGDSMGYLYDVNGSQMNGLHLFMHELYDHESDQAADEFFRSFEGSIEEFLEP